MKKKAVRSIVLCFLLSVIICIALYTSATSKNENVYLNEEVCFADNVYFKVDKMSVTENTENNTDQDGDELSKYILNIEISVQRKDNKNKNEPIEISPKMFKLKSVNLKSKSKMSVFFESMLKASISALLSGAVDGDINIIEETIGFAQEYVTGSIENAKFKVDFKPISADTNSFETFTLDNQNDAIYINLHFPIKEEYIESENVVVLSVSTWWYGETKIFLIPRPTKT